jgi:hypothetical protein
MQTQELLEYLDVPFSFHERPTPLQPQLRIIWGLATLVLILEYSRSQRSSISRLHLLNWAVRNNENRKRLIELLADRFSPLSTLIRYEPGFSRAIEYALAEGLIEMGNNGRVSLAQNGRKLAKEIIAVEDCLKEEKEFLRDKGPAVNETVAKSLLG